MLSRSMDFITYMDECGMTDAGYTWNTYTWCNRGRKRKRISKILDKVIIKDDWAEF